MCGFHIRIHIYIHIAKSERANVNDWISPNAHNLKLWWMNAIRKESGAFLSQKHTYTHTDNIMIIIIITTTIMEYIYMYIYVDENEEEKRNKNKSNLSTMLP